MTNLELQNTILADLRTLSAPIGLRFSEFSPENQNLPRSISIGMTYKGVDLMGFGSAPSKDHAAFSAVMELFERFVFFYGKKEKKFKRQCGLFQNARPLSELERLYKGSKNLIGPTTNGYAVHTNFFAATESAINEIIERHVILKAMALGLSPAKAAAPAAIGREYKIPDSITPTFFVWKGPLNRYVSLLRLQSNLRVCFGFGAHVDLEKAKEKAFFEAAPRIELLSSNADEGSLPDSLGSNFKSHYAIEQPWTKNWLEAGSEISIPELDTDISRKDIWTRCLPLPDPFMRLNKKIFAVQAICPLMQPLFVGDWSHGKINPLALGGLKALPPEIHMVG